MGVTIEGMTIKNDVSRERDRFTVVLEAIQSDFRVFGEKLEFIDAHLDNIDARLDAIEAHLDRIDARLDKIEAHLDVVESRLDKIEMRLDKIESELADVKLEIPVLRIKLDKKADIERLEKLEGRVKHAAIVLAKERGR